MESPTKKSLLQYNDEDEKPFPGEMARDYSQSNIQDIRAASVKARSTMGRTLGKTVSAPVISDSQPTSPPTRAPLHSRDNSLRELQPYGDLKMAGTEMDGFDIEEMDEPMTPQMTPTASPSKKRSRDTEEADEAVAMDEDSPSPSPSRGPIKGLGNRALGRAQTEPNLSFNDSF